MSETRMTRKERFLVALSRSPYRSANEWAREVGGVSRTHLMLVLDGGRESATLDEKIDAFILALLGPDKAGALVG